MSGKTIEPGIRQLAPKVYEVRVGLGRDEDGRLVQRSRTVRGSLPLVRRLIAEAAKEKGGAEMARLFFVAATTGARRAELCGLRWGDIDWTTGSIVIQRSLLDLPGQAVSEKGPKSRRGRRRVELDTSS